LILFMGAMESKRSFDSPNLLLLDICVSMLYTSCFIAQFILANACLIVRFKALNRCIQSSSKSHFIKFLHSKDEKTEKFAKLFDKLCDGIEIVNETFTFQFILGFLHDLVRFSTF
jgi:hypothetical protein